MWIWLCFLFGCSDYQLNNNLESYPLPHYLEPNLGSAIDQYLIPKYPQHDILFVVDNSCSMADDQEKLINNIEIFMSWFLDNKIDFHLGVVTTDMYEPYYSGNLMPDSAGNLWIDKYTPDLYGAFFDMAAHGTGGHLTEMARGPVYVALEEKRYTTHKDFLREHASLHVIVISDEDDQTSSSIISQTEFIAWMNAFKTNKDQVTYSGIISAAEDNHHTPIIQQVGGSQQDIYAKDWSLTLDSVLDDIIFERKNYSLSDLPAPESIVVHILRGINTIVINNTEWKYYKKENSVSILPKLVRAHDKIVIQYDLAR